MQATVRLLRCLQFGVTLRSLAYKMRKTLCFQPDVHSGEYYIGDIPFLLVCQHCFSNRQLVCTICPCYILRYPGDNIRCFLNCNRTKTESNLSDFSDHHQHCLPFAQPAFQLHLPKEALQSTPEHGSLTKSKYPTTASR